MEVLQLLIGALPDSTLGIIAALAVYLVITNNRKDTKKERDEQMSLFGYRLDQMEQQSKYFADKLENVVEILNWIKVELAKMNNKK